MRYGVSLSAALHVALIVLALVGLPDLFDPEPPEITPIAVEMVSPEEFEKQTAKKPEPAKPEPKPAPPKVETPPPAPPPPPEPEPQQTLDIPKPEPMPPPRPEPAPEPEPVPKVEPLPKPLAKPKPPEPEPPKPEPPKPEPPKKEAPRNEQVAAPPPTPAPQPKRKPEAPPDEFQSLLKNLARQRERAQKEKADEPKQQAARPAEQAQERSPLERRRIAATLAQNIMQQVSPCWSIPAGVKDAQDMSVAIRIRLNPDGGLGAQPRIEDTGRMSSDPSFRALAESALRALRNPVCVPLRLPYEQYDVWRDITFVFDPREALGQ